MYLIEGKDEMVLFDTGYGFDNIKPLINKLSNKPYEVICSHGHLDHIGGNSEFDLGDLHLRFIKLPGHTKGSIGLYWIEKKCLYVLDAINGYLYLFLEESEMLSKYIKTLEKVEWKRLISII